MNPARAELAEEIRLVRERAEAREGMDGDEADQVVWHLEEAEKIVRGVLKNAR